MRKGNFLNFEVPKRTTVSPLAVIRLISQTSSLDGPVCGIVE
jgi:hypothetical protein